MSSNRTSLNALALCAVVVSFIVTVVHNQVAIWLWTKLDVTGFLVSATGYILLGAVWAWHFYQRRHVVSERRQNLTGALILGGFPIVFGILDVMAYFKFVN